MFNTHEAQVIPPIFMYVHAHAHAHTTPSCMSAKHPNEIVIIIIITVNGQACTEILDTFLFPWMEGRFIKKYICLDNKES